ncbi:MAG TPA: DUF732 domain-containing protein [Mycobacterium sp.]|nr:DUF732 domain-containing protein [Mycobacterium sp.]
MRKDYGLAIASGLLVGMLGVAALPTAPRASADVVAYLVNVTVRPGYNFPNGDAAVGYGRGICDKVRGGRGYPDVMADVKRDFGTADDYQASYLINQAVGELCPTQIWQLRISAAHYNSDYRIGSTR